MDTKYCCWGRWVFTACCHAGEHYFKRNANWLMQMIDLNKKEIKYWWNTVHTVKSKLDGQFKSRPLVDQYFFISNVKSDFAVFDILLRYYALENDRYGGISKTFLFFVWGNINLLLNFLGHRLNWGLEIFKSVVKEYQFISKRTMSWCI